MITGDLIQENFEVKGGRFVFSDLKCEVKFEGFATQYDEMQILISNDSLVAQLEREKLRTQRLLEELRATKASNAAEITRLKKELKPCVP